MIESGYIVNSDGVSFEVGSDTILDNKLMENCRFFETEKDMQDHVMAIHNCDRDEVCIPWSIYSDRWVCDRGFSSAFNSEKGDDFSGAEDFVNRLYI
jgi:hypothetical protein